MTAEQELRLLLVDTSPIHVVTDGQGRQFDLALGHPTLGHSEIWISGEREGGTDEWFLSDGGYLQNTFASESIEALVCAGAPFYSKIGPKSGVYTNTANLVSMITQLAFHIACADVAVAAIGCAQVTRTDRSVTEDPIQDALVGSTRDTMISAHALAGQYVKEAHRIRTISDSPKTTVPLAVVNQDAVGVATGVVAFDARNHGQRVKNLDFVWSVIARTTKYRFVVTKSATEQQFRELRSLWEPDNVYVLASESGLEDLKEATEELVEGYFQAQ